MSCAIVLAREEVVPPPRGPTYYFLFLAFSIST